MRTAILVLASGEIFQGHAIGAAGFSVGEVVFNTSMTGYQEIITDPSYAKQIITLTCPHIGNVGTNSLDSEAFQIAAAGLIVRDASLITSSWRAETNLTSYLKQHNVLAIAGIDTRRLTRILREHGARNGCIAACAEGEIVDIGQLQQTALEKAQAFAGLNNMDLAKEVSTQTPYTWQKTEWCDKANHYPEQKNADTKYHVVAYDFGIKHNILRKLAERNCQLTIVPAQTPVAEVLALAPDGVFLSNGPGDPAPCDYAITAAQTLIAQNIPLFGICLGMQIISLAVGAKTLKMKFGHHGANHPVQCIETKKVMITSQNHGFTVDETSLPDHVQITHRSLFDGSLQGIRLTNAPVIAFQGHPEASPGPQDIDGLFDAFIALM